MIEPLTTLATLGALSIPATALINKISSAAGIIFEPIRIKRAAIAEAKADHIKAKSGIEIRDLEQVALQRLCLEEVVKQQNIESIVVQAISTLNDEASADDIDNDWLLHFFDKCRLVSDQDFQKVWSAILSGEANSPGQFSKRTITLLSTLDKNEASLFQQLCSFSVIFGNKLTPVILDLESEVYLSKGITALSLIELEHTGLIKSHIPGIFCPGGFNQDAPATVSYKNTQFKFEYTTPNNVLILGYASFTQSGLQLASICDSEGVPGFLEYLISEWNKEGTTVSVR